MKHITINVEENSHRAAQAMRMNVSEICRDAIKSAVAVAKGDPTSIHIEIEQKRRNRLLKQQAEINAQLHITQGNIHTWEKSQEEEEEKRLLEEKEKIEAERVCVVCSKKATRFYQTAKGAQLPMCADNACISNYEGPA